jgi:hypothetical protein
MSDNKNEMRELLNIINESLDGREVVNLDPIDEYAASKDIHTADSAANIGAVERVSPQLNGLIGKIMKAIEGLEGEAEFKREIVRVISYLASFIRGGEGSDPNAKLAYGAEYGLGRVEWDDSNPMHGKIKNAIMKLAHYADDFVRGETDEL